MPDMPSPPAAVAKPVVLGIAGCSGSGKTTLARKVAAQLEATLFPLDLYYRDLAQFPLDVREKRNFDHPDALESELFTEHIRLLAQGKSIERPIYDFATHTRVAGAFETVTPARFVLVEGILALHYPALLPMYDFSVYVDAPQELCLSRRIRRDMRERGRTEASVREQFEAAVRPMAERYVLPSRTKAMLRVSGSGSLGLAIGQVLHALKERRFLP